MKKTVSRSFVAFAALLLTQPIVHADPLKITPSLAGFKQIGPRFVELVFALDVQEKIPAGYLQFVHVTNPNATPSQFQIGTGIESKPETWETGQTLTGSLVVLPLQNDLPDGEYEIKFGIYNTVKGDRLELTGKDDGQRRYILGKMTLADGGKSIAMPGVPTVTPTMEGRLKVTPSLTDFAQTGPRAFSFRLVYDVQEKLPAGEEVFVHLTYAVPSPGKDNILGVGSGIATNPDSWPVGQKTTGDVTTVTLPETLPDGSYTLRTGLYAAKGNGQRVKLTGEDDGGRRFVIGTVRLSEGGKKVGLAGAVDQH